MALKRYRPRRVVRRRRAVSRVKKGLSPLAIRGGRMYSMQVPRLRQLRTHYFKRVGAQIPFTFQYTTTHPTTTNGLAITCPSVLTSGGANILGYNMASSVSTTPLNCASGVSIYGGTGSPVPNTQSFGFSIQFSLQQVMEHLDFTTLFDRYKILGVKIQIIWHSNVAQMNNAAVFPTMYQIFDGDDATVPTSKNTMLKQEGVKVKTLSRAGKYSFYCKPRQLISPSTSTAGSTNALTQRANWINSADAGVNHFGMKFFIDDIPYANGCYNLLQIQPTFYLACKDTL